MTFFTTDDFEFGTLISLGQAATGGSDVGEVLSTVARITDGDAESWFTEWTATATRVLAAADECAKGTHRISAAAGYLRASTYFARALESLDATPDTSRLLPTWRQHRDAWDKWIHTQTHVRQLAIAYEGTTMPGYLFLAAGTKPRPVVILVNGSDGSVADNWCSGGQAALDRGYHAVVFDGPGQQSLLFEQDIPFRPDWEHVLGPVIDEVVQHPRVDADAVSAIGWSQGGCWVARAAAYEKRLRAIALDPGVYDVSTSWTSHLPDFMLPMLDDTGPDAAKNFDDFIAVGLKDDPAAAATLAFRMRPYGTTSPYEAYNLARTHTLKGITDLITCPTLVLSPDNEQFWPGQAQQVHEAIAGSELVAFTQAEGADIHCEPRSPAVRNQRLFDWLDTELNAPR